MTGRKSDQCEVISEESIIIPDYFPDAGSRPDSHGLIGALFSPSEEKAEQGTDYMLQATELILGGFQQTLPAWLQKFSNKRVSGPTRSHGLIAKLICDFSKGAGHNSPITAYFLDHVPESSPRKSEFPTTGMHRHGGWLLGRGPFIKCLTKSQNLCSLFFFFFFLDKKNSNHSTDASAVDRAMPLHGNQ